MQTKFQNQRPNDVETPVPSIWVQKWSNIGTVSTWMGDRLEWYPPPRKNADCSCWLPVPWPVAWPRYKQTNKQTNKQTKFDEANLGSHSRRCLSRWFTNNTNPLKKSCYWIKNTLALQFHAVWPSLRRLAWPRKGAKIWTSVSCKMLLLLLLLKVYVFWNTCSLYFSTEVKQHQDSQYLDGWPPYGFVFIPPLRKQLNSVVSITSWEIDPIREGTPHPLVGPGFMTWAVIRPRAEQEPYIKDPHAYRCINIFGMRSCTLFFFFLSWYMYIRNMRSRRWFHMFFCLCVCSSS
jgi:hypothetical protein